VLGVFHKGSKREIALKIARVSAEFPHHASNLKSEIKMLRELKHKNIIKVHNPEQSQIF
jgi:hypothetical protein